MNFQVLTGGAGGPGGYYSDRHPAEVGDSGGVRIRRRCRVSSRVGSCVSNRVGIYCGARVVTAASEPPFEVHDISKSGGHGEGTTHHPVTRM